MVYKGLGVYSSPLKRAKPSYVNGFYMTYGTPISKFFYLTFLNGWDNITLLVVTN